MNNGSPIKSEVIAPPAHPPTPNRSLVVGDDLNMKAKTYQETRRKQKTREIEDDSDEEEFNSEGEADVLVYDESDEDDLDEDAILEDDVRREEAQREADRKYVEQMSRLCHECHCHPPSRNSDHGLCYKCDRLRKDQEYRKILSMKKKNIRTRVMIETKRSQLTFEADLKQEARTLKQELRLMEEEFKKQKRSTKKQRRI